MTLLMQIYAPLDEKVVGHGEAFHRMIFVFACKTGFCHQSSSPFVVWRCQLPKDNPFIEDIPEDDEDDDQIEEDESDFQINPPAYSNDDLDLHRRLSWISYRLPSLLKSLLNSLLISLLISLLNSLLTSLLISLLDLLSFDLSLDLSLDLYLELSLLISICQSLS